MTRQHPSPLTLQLVTHPAAHTCAGELGVTFNIEMSTVTSSQKARPHLYTPTLHVNPTDLQNAGRPSTRPGASTATFSSGV